MSREHLTKTERVERARLAFSEAVQDAEKYAHLAQIGSEDRRTIYADIARAAHASAKRWAAHLHHLTA